MGKNANKGLKGLSLASGLTAFCLLIIEVRGFISTSQSAAFTPATALECGIYLAGVVCMVIGALARWRIPFGIGAVAASLQYLMNAVRYINVITSYNVTWSVNPLYILETSYWLCLGVAYALLALMAFARASSIRRPMLVLTLVIAAIGFISRGYEIYLSNNATYDNGGTSYALWAFSTCVFVLVPILSSLATAKGALDRTGNKGKSQTTPQHAPTPNEMLRLHALMEEGALTQEEFESLRERFVQ